MASPRRTASQLRKIADNLEASSNPSRELVARDIKRVVASLTRAAASNVKVDESTSKIEDWGGFDIFVLVEKEEGTYKIRVYDFDDDGVGYDIERDGEEIFSEDLPFQGGTSTPSEILTYVGSFEKNGKLFFTPEEISSIVKVLDDWYESASPQEESAVSVPEPGSFFWFEKPESRYTPAYRETHNNYPFALSREGKDLSLPPRAWKDLKSFLNKWYVDKGFAPSGTNNIFQSGAAHANETYKECPMWTKNDWPMLEGQDLQALLDAVNGWWQNSDYELVTGD